MLFRFGIYFTLQLILNHIAFRIRLQPSLLQKILSGLAFRPDVPFSIFSY